MEFELKKIRAQFDAQAESAKTTEQLKRLRSDFLGRKGVLPTFLRRIKELTLVERARVGKMANDMRQELEVKLGQLEGAMGAGRSKQSVDFDPTQPGRSVELGHLHPLTTLQYQLEDILMQMGFVTIDGPEVESEFYNFTALNVPSDHPARDAQDTFWLTNGHLLRTHTSPVQVRALQKHGAPLRCIVPGRVFRHEATDPSHDHTFNQMEGFMVDRNVSVANLIEVMRVFLQQVFTAQVDIRLRPSYFPFVEPGFELDMKCLICRGDGCSVCKRVGWLEMLGCGMVHPAVLVAGNVDPEKFSGFAFGLGVTRLAMMKYGIDHIRHFYSGDLRFIRQF